MRPNKTFLNKNFLAAAVFTSMTFGGVAWAAPDSGGFFVEPSVSYGITEVKVDYPSPFSSSEEDVNSLGLGVRLGGHIHEAIFLAIDGRYRFLRYDSGALGEKVDGQAFNFGPTLGIQTPVAGLRIWGTYIMDGEMNPDRIDDVDYKFEDLEGYRIGAGLYIGSLSVNAEYMKATYDTVDFNKLGPFSPGDISSIDGDEEGYLVSVSFPAAL